MKKIDPKKNPVNIQNHGRTYRGQPSYAIPLWNGVIEHREKIGPAIWEFIWCLDKITVEDDRGIGWLLGKTPIDTKRIADDLIEHENTAHANMNRLAVEGYIVRKRTPRGYCVGVVNSRKFSARRKNESQETLTHSESESQETMIRESQETVTHPAGESQFSGEVNHSFQGSESQKTVVRRDFTETVQEDKAVQSDFSKNDSTPLSQTLSPKNPTLERERLREWAKTIILKRAPSTVRNQQAFLKTSLDEFFQNLPAEVESYLTEQAKAYVDRAMWDAPDLPIGFLEISNHLDHLRQELDLPLNPDDPRIVDRILNGVKEANLDTLLVAEPFGFFPSPKWQTYRQDNSSKYPIRGWNESRTAVSGYIPSSPGLGTLLWSRPGKISFMAEMLETNPEQAGTSGTIGC
jgi:hypothetical protein